MSKILVTGGAGFIGSHTCVELLEHGHEVIIFDNFSNSSPEAVQAVREITGKDALLIEGDLLDAAAVEAVFTQHKIDAVIHFAGLKAVGESVEQPLRYYHNNLTGTLHLLQSMQNHGCRTLVFSSSATVYGMNNVSPFQEDAALSATNPYGSTKLFIEQMLRDLCIAEDDWSVVLLRYFNPVGAHKSGLIGENPSGIPNNLVPYIARVAQGTLPHLNVYGNDYDTPDGTGVRDYIHVVDLAQGHLAALDFALGHKGSEAINLGTGAGTSVLEMLHAYEKASGKTLAYEMAPRRAGDIATCFADTAKAERLLGWKAQKNVADMCEDSWRFTSLHG